MAVSQNAIVTPQKPKLWTASIGNGDASLWKKLLDASGTQIGAGTDSSKITAVSGVTNDGTARDFQLAICRSISATCTSASPGVVSISGGHNLVAGDQFFFSGTTAATGTTLGTTYFVIATGLTATAFQFAATAGGTAINTSSTGTALVVNYIRVLTTVSLGITAGTVSTLGSVNFLNTTNFPGCPVDNDGQPYLFLEGTATGSQGDFLAVSCTGTVTANKVANITAVGANFS